MQYVAGVDNPVSMNLYAHPHTSVVTAIPEGYEGMRGDGYHLVCEAAAANTKALVLVGDGARTEFVLKNYGAISVTDNSVGGMANLFLRALAVPMDDPDRLERAGRLN